MSVVTGESGESKDEPRKAPGTNQKVIQPDSSGMNTKEANEEKKKKEEEEKLWNTKEYLARQRRRTDEEKDGVIGRVIWKSFRFLVEHFAFEAGETYYLVGPRDDAQHERLVQKIRAAGWHAQSVSGRVIESRLADAYHTLDGRTVCCEILRTDLEDAKRENYRSVANIHTAEPRIEHRLYTQAESVMIKPEEGKEPEPGWSCEGPRLASRGDNFVRIDVPKRGAV